MHKSSSFSIMANEQRSLFITLAAQAMSSVGFSVSILAWLWLTIVPPLPPQLAEPITIDKKARRRSAPAALQSHKQSSPSQSRSPDETSLISFPPRKRRVYFADSPSRPTNQFEVAQTPNDSLDMFDKPLPYLPAAEISPSSSSSTLVHTYTALPLPTLETCRESAVESDSSNSSPRRSLSLSRPFRRSSGTSVPDTSPIIATPGLLPCLTADRRSNTLLASNTRQRRSSGSLMSPWSFRRASDSRSTPKPGASSVSPTTPVSPTTSPAPSYFARKTARRASTPVPRTQPYAYPYFAQPPVDDEVYIAYLRSLPQPGTDVLARSPTASDSEKESLLNWGSRNRKLNDKAQAALGLGRRPPVQQRSAGEGCVAEGDPRL
ncbi:hypothetical protein GGX14DRAFT_478620 [Mycena pura]|uniref:Uncharacterized protein n=1 Tax=Mycena pura TaxID=153505 RepID=A0AAD6Y0E2_9AGAR|nr:hypothetical protein GGX14DRAFT_478620 [Mycena pura]